MLSTTTKINEVFNYWIESSNSEGTKKAYGRIVPQFFQMLLGKDLQDVTKDDLESLVPLTVNKKYKEELSKSGIKNSTIINNLTVISGFFKQLEINKVFDGVNYAWIREVLLNTKRIKSDKVHRGNMSFKDYEDIKDWLSKYSFSERYVEKSEQYALLIEFMWVTASRISAVFNVRWSDIRYEEDGIGNYGYVVYVYDKGGKVNKKPISTEFYNRLKNSLFKEDVIDKVFSNLSQIGFTKLIKEYCELTGKEFTPHSIKRGSVTFLYSITHDLVLTQRFADHDDPKTTVGYIQSEPDHTQQGSYILSKKLDFKKIDQLTKEQLMSIIDEHQDLAYRILSEAERKHIIEG